MLFSKRIKEEQHEGDVYYFRNDNEVSIDFELNVADDDVKAINEKAEETEESKNIVLKSISKVNHSLLEDEDMLKYFENVCQYIPNAENGGIHFLRIVDNQEKEVTIYLNRTLNMDYARR